MGRMMIALDRVTTEELVRVATAKRRDPREQAALYIERAIAAETRQSGDHAPEPPAA